MPSTPYGGATVAALWRYPVKSMAGQRLESVEVTRRGLHLDRAFALVDTADGRVATAKNPRKWPHLFGFAAVPDPADGAGVLVTLPDGTRVRSDDPGAADVLSRALGRRVRLAEAGVPTPGAGPATPWEPRAEELAADLDGRGEQEVTDFALPEGSFADAAAVHLLTTATLARLDELHPGGAMAVRRFRPNVVVDTGADRAGFVENEWVGRTLRLGDSVRLAVTGPCQRCVMTTLPQGDLSKDVGVLRTVVRANAGAAGVYASVLRGGTVRRGDPAVLE